MKNIAHKNCECSDTKQENRDANSHENEHA